jgi:hypothetical protein
VYAAVPCPLYSSGTQISLPSRVANTYTLQFDGADDYVDLPSQPIPNSGFTVEAWIYGSSWAFSGRFARILAVDFAGYSYDNPFAFLVTGTGQLGYVFSSGLADLDTQAPHASSPTLATNTWYHVALSFDGNRKNLYVGGVLRLTVINAITFTNALNNRLLLGDFNSASNGSGEWKGELDEIRVWSIARSDVQLQSAMNSFLAGTETNLVAYYALEEGNGYQVQDAVLGQYGAIKNQNPARWLSNTIARRPPAGCTCLGAYVGSITPSSVAPNYYTGTCLAQCPTPIASFPYSIGAGASLGGDTRTVSRVFLFSNITHGCPASIVMRYVGLMGLLSCRSRVPWVIWLVARKASLVSRRPQHGPT